MNQNGTGDIVMQKHAHKLTRDSLYSLEEYSNVRSDFRSKVLAHKKERR